MELVEDLGAKVNKSSYINEYNVGQRIIFIQMMSLTIGLFTQVSDSGPQGPLVTNVITFSYTLHV